MKDRLGRTITLAIPGSISLMPLLVLPVMVGGFVDSLQLSESEAGWLASAGFLGTAAGSILIALRIHHLDLRKLAAIGLGMMIITDGLSTGASIFPTWLLAMLRAISGLGAAAVYAAVMTTYARQHEPDRAYGIFMAIQFTFSAIGLYLLPFWLSHIQLSGMFLAFTLLNVCALMCLRSLPSRTEPLGQVVDAPLEWRVLAARTSLVCLLAIGLYETANMMQFTYIERIGVSFDLAAEEIGLALGIATVIGIPAGFGVALLGDRFGHFRPIAVAALIQAAALVMLTRIDGGSGYLFAMCLLGAGWAFALPYFQAIEAELDPGGSVVVAGSFATGFAGFVGPAAAAMLVAPQSYTNMLLTATGTYVVAVILVRYVNVRIRN